MFKQKFYLIIFAVWQLFSTALIATNVWPAQVIYLNLGLQLLAILLFDLEYALYSVILTIPFYLAVPNPKFDSLSAWRFTFLALFLMTWWKSKKAGQKMKLYAWDSSLYMLALAILLSILFEPFKTVGIKKFIFVANVYLLYAAAVNILKTKEQILRAAKVILISLASVILIGYLQLIVTFSSGLYYFWQYWAELIAKTYYGKTLADTLTYSNSWFSFYPDAPPSLRMFSILPDSHSFAVLAAFAVPYATALLYFVKNKWQKTALWIFIVLAVLSVILSGTRGVWVGILAPLAILLYLFARRWGRKLITPMFLPVIIFIALFLVSPLIQKTITSGRESGSFWQRATSIYDLSDASNSGRLMIWKNTLQFAFSHPLVGAGFGNFVVTLDKNNNPQASYNDLATQKVKTFNLPKQYITAHNLYLDFLAETGLIGLFFFLLYIKKLALGFWRFFKERYLFSEDGYVFLAVNIGLYLVWLFAYSLFDGTLLNDRVLMFFFLNLAISASIMKVYSK